MLNTPMPPRGANALLLGRYSSEHQNPLSADDQIAACVEVCEKFGWTVRGTYKDEAKSGRSVAKRSGYLAMMAAAEQGPVDVIVATSLDRIGRNARELHDARDRLLDANAVIYTLDRGVMDRMQFAIFAELAQFESEKIATRVSFGHRAAAKRGKVMGDVAYGYRAAMDPDGNRRVEIDPPTAAIVLRINQDYAAGLSPVKIAAALTAEGVPTPEGLAVWSPNTILGTRRSGNGLLRNPLHDGRIVFGKTKVRLDPKTGRFIKRKAAKEELVETDAPWLRILPEELWRQVQDLLLQRAFTWDKRQGDEEADPDSPKVSSDEPTLTPPHMNRRPTYLLTGLTKCGVCGGAFALTTAKLGCVNLRVGACDNSRRVEREDLERVVLEGLKGRLAQAHIISWFLPEYLQEAERAAQEGAGKATLQRAHLEEVEREIANLLKQARAGAEGYAAKLLNDNLASLGLKQERLARELRVARPAPPPPLDADAATGKLHALLDDLGAALQGDERDATRARDIIRTFIHRIVVTPIAPEGRPDGRGCGPVRITVEGAISTLVDHALLDRKILHSRSTGAVHNPPTLGFRYYVDLDRRLSLAQEGVYADQAVLARRLEETEVPLRRQDLLAALYDDPGRDPGRDSDDTALLERRLDFALRALRRSQWVRSVGQGTEASWVWNGRDLSDEDWLDRFRRPAAFPPPLRAVRVSPPQAHVVVIGHAIPDPVDATANPSPSRSQKPYHPGRRKRAQQP